MASTSNTEINTVEVETSEQILKRNNEEMKKTLQIINDRLKQEEQDEDNLCQVCYTNEYSRRNHKVQCLTCNHHCCFSCQKRYFTDTQVINCMNCGHEYDNIFIQNNFTKTYILGDLKCKREQLLYEQHLSQLQNPIIMQKANLVYKIRQYKNNYFTALTAIEYVQEEYDCKAISYEKYKVLMDMATQKFNKIQIQSITNSKNSQQLQYLNNPQLVNATTQPKNQEEKIKVTRACPQSECRGFLNEHSVCQMCNAWICDNCNELKCILTDNSINPNKIPLTKEEKKEQEEQQLNEEKQKKYKEHPHEHKCNEDNVKSFELIKKDSKNCPQCRAFIFRIEGCYQMWCTNCNIGFCWKTGKTIQNNRIHNPHFFQWLNAQTRNANVREIGDVPCGGLLNGQQLNNLISKINTNNKNCLDKPTTDKFMEINRHLLHIQDVERRKYPIIIPDYLYNALYIEYLSHQLTQKQFKSKLFAYQKKSSKNTEIRQLFDLVNTIGVEQLNQIVNEQDTKDTEKIINIFEQYFITIESIRKYYNQEMQKLLERYDSRITNIFLKQPFTITSINYARA